jgi:hypothetical protein
LSTAAGVGVPAGPESTLHAEAEITRSRMNAFLFTFRPFYKRAWMSEYNLDHRPLLQGTALEEGSQVIS